jgi:tetratricopeptide (TPR) repeat protein
MYDLLVTFAPYMERRGHWATWKQLLDRADKAAQQLEDMAGLITLSALLARLLQRQSQLTQAIYHYRQVIRWARQSKNLYEEARACTNLGYLYIEEGHWHRAEVLCCHALTIFESINSNHGRAHTENHLGFLYTRQSIWEKAEHYLEQACLIWQSMGDNHGLMRGFINLGVLYNERERPDLALPALEKARQYAELAGEEAEIGKIYLNMGVTCRLKGESVQAEACAWQAEAIFRRFSNSSDLALVWINLGAAYTDQGWWQEAEKYLETALKACQTLKYEYGEIKALMGIIEYELARQDYQQAARRLSRLEDFIQAPDKILRYRYLQPHLTKYRYNLARNLKKTSGVLGTSEVLSD